MYRKILVPYDQSVPAKHALRAALELAEGTPDAEITVLNVVEWHDFNAETFKIASRLSGVLGNSLDMNAIADVSEEAARETSEKVLADIGDLITSPDEIKIAIVNGSAHDTITAFAEEGDYDVIVMGHRGLGAFRGMLGSVCYSVLQKTTKPVLIIK